MFIKTRVFCVLAILVPLVASTAQAISWADYDHLDPHHLVPTKALQQALAYYDQVKHSIENSKVLTVIDYSQHSNQRRFYLIDLKTGAVEAYKVAHGRGSDTNHDGWAERFSNINNSKATSLGFYLTGKTYRGKYGNSLYLDGLSQTNNNARTRAIVIHGAPYVSEQRSTVGRSWGCPALDRKLSDKIIHRIKGGSLIYAWAGQTPRNLAEN